MKPITIHVGRGLPLDRDDIDTDQIIPSSFCRRLTKEGYADGLFGRWREDPRFILNDPRRAGASVLVAGANFGTGSSREHAVWALRDWGIAAVVASSYGDIFRRNAFKNGLLAVELPAPDLAELRELVEADLDAEIVVDLERCEVRAGGRCCPFTVDARARRLLLNGLDDIAATLESEAAIAGYETARRSWLPVVPVAVGDRRGSPRQLAL